MDDFFTAKSGWYCWLIAERKFVQKKDKYMVQSTSVYLSIQKYWLSSYYIPGTILGSSDSKNHKASTLAELTFHRI